MSNLDPTKAHPDTMWEILCHCTTDAGVSFVIPVTVYADTQDAGMIRAIKKMQAEGADILLHREAKEYSHVPVLACIPLDAKRINDVQEFSRVPKPAERLIRPS